MADGGPVRLLERVWIHTEVAKTSLGKSASSKSRAVVTVIYRLPLEFPLPPALPGPNVSRVLPGRGKMARVTIANACARSTVSTAEIGIAQETIVALAVVHELSSPRSSSGLGLADHVPAT
jgi:hypothetical protein